MLAYLLFSQQHHNPKQPRPTHPQQEKKSNALNAELHAPDALSNEQQAQASVTDPCNAESADESHARSRAKIGNSQQHGSHHAHSPPARTLEQSNQSAAAASPEGAASHNRAQDWPAQCCEQDEAPDAMPGATETGVAASVRPNAPSDAEPDPHSPHRGQNSMTTMPSRATTPTSMATGFKSDEGSCIEAAGSESGPVSAQQSQSKQEANKLMFRAQLTCNEVDPQRRVRLQAVLSQYLPPHVRSRVRSA